MAGQILYHTLRDAHTDPGFSAITDLLSGRPVNTIAVVRAGYCEM